MASKKKGLPFVVQPRLKSIIEELGSEESGTIRIERKGYLTVAEKQFVQNASEDDTSLAQIHLLSAKVAKAKGCTVAEALSSIGGAGDSSLLEGFETEATSALAAMMVHQERQHLIHAACLLMLRLDVEVSMDDVLELHPDLLVALAILYREEEAKSIEALEEAHSAEAKEQSEGK
jgi:hypothetical protein